MARLAGIKQLHGKKIIPDTWNSFFVKTRAGMIFTCYQKCIFHKKDYLNRISFKYPVPAKRHEFSQIISLLGMSCNIFSLKKYVKWYCTWTAPQTWAVKIHSVKSVQIRSFFLSVFSCIRTEYEDLRKSPYSVWIQENTEQKKIRTWTLFMHW